MGNCCKNCFKKSAAISKVQTNPSIHSAKHNYLLDRLTPNQLSIIESIFTRHKGQGSGINFARFLEMLPKLSQFSTEIQKSAFRMYDKDKIGEIT